MHQSDATAPTYGTWHRWKWWLLLLVGCAIAAVGFVWQAPRHLAYARIIDEDRADGRLSLEVRQEAMAPIAKELSEEITVGTTRIRLPASVHPRAHATRLGKQVVMDGGYVFLDDAMNRDRTAKLVQDDCKLLGIVYGLAVERGSTSLKREVEDDWAAAIGRVLSAVPMGHWRLALLPSEEADAYAARLALKRALTPLKSELPVLNAGDVAGLACVEERDGSKIRLYMYQRRSKVLQIMEVQASGDEIVNVVRAIMQSWHVVE